MNEYARDAVVSLGVVAVILAVIAAIFFYSTWPTKVAVCPRCQLQFGVFAETGTPGKVDTKHQVHND